MYGQLRGWKTGFEPATSGITIQRSNQLSYNHQVGCFLIKLRKGNSFLTNAEVLSHNY